MWSRRRPHGWPANSEWEHVETTRADDHLTAVFILAHKVMGATLEKRITLRAGHPFIYQEHRFEGGQGAVSAGASCDGSHAGGRRLAVSPKAFAFTPPESRLEPDPARGRSILAYPARSEDLGAFPLAGGGTTDLTRYPPGESHEDFLTLVERQDGNRNGAALGWSVISRTAEQDRVLILEEQPNPAGHNAVDEQWRP
jgi:hypothetical protein